MTKVDIVPQESGVPRVATDDTRLWQSAAEIRWHWKMLDVPRPAETIEDLADLETARRALAEPGAPIPYDEVRRELGLA